MNMASHTKSAEDSPTFRAIMAYGHPSLVHRLQEKLGISAEMAAELFNDTKRFLYLCADSNVPMSPPPAIDECWHLFILFTKDYARFCEQYFGVFLHHRPHYINDPPTNGSHRINSLNAAEKQFANLSANWAFPKETIANCDKCAGCQEDKTTLVTA
jgi:hypothetical protein